ncbi:uncharacterized protein TNIN_376181 [Trichonephila inaurata madagascariensis]|uniref:Uncharacterized protein n=1 Tax=Trichonephila inaurata madagascariensis TaxID=2747483 RepID=A0A8X6Y641_9ARAC|nr:uncharacterized protein TNIN_376181 [Trichonephila inaurata madagascariensis]
MTTENNDKILNRELKKQFGMFWIVLRLTGISIFEENQRRGLPNFGFTISKLLFPLLLHCNFVYLWYCTASVGKLNYGLIIDLLLPLLTCVLWWMIYRRRKSLKDFLFHFNESTLSCLNKPSRYLSCTINTALCLIVVYTPFLIAMNALQRNGEPMPLLEILRFLQEMIFPSIVNIIYNAICYSLLRNLISMKDSFNKQLNMACPLSTTKLSKNYVEIIKDVEVFEDLFSAPVFILVLKDFCTISITIMDMMYVPNWMSKLGTEASFYFLYIFGTLGFLTICAANIPLEMQRIRSVLLNKMSASSLEGGLLCNEKNIELLLNRDVCVLTACNVFQFDRGFLLKALISVIAQAAVFFQLGSLLKGTSSKNENSTFNNSVAKLQ